METKGKLTEEHYYIYETFKTYRHAPLFGVEPRTLMVFKTRTDALAFQAAFLLLPLLTLRRVSIEELNHIINTEFNQNYVILSDDDLYLVASRYEFLHLRNYRAPE